MTALIPLLAASVRMAMMDVGEMRMRVGQRQMCMGMQMGLFTVPFKLVLMLMMRIMDVPMRMDNAIG